MRPLVESIGIDFMIPADVTDDASMDAALASVKEKWGKIDFLVHSIAFAGKDELVGSMVENTTREGFRRAMDISVYSFTEAKAASIEASSVTSAGIMKSMPMDSTSGRTRRSRFSP